MKTQPHSAISMAVDCESNVTALIHTLNVKRSQSGPLTHPLNVSDGRHRAGVFEVVGQHGHEMVGGACDPLQLHIGLHQVGQCLCTLHPLLKQMLFTAHPHEARQGLDEKQKVTCTLNKEMSLI